MHGMFPKETHTYDILECLEKGVYNLDILEVALTFHGDEQRALFELARKRRDDAFPKREVEVRSVIEISNRCRQRCNYCAIGGEKSIRMYMIDESTMISLMEYLYRKGRRVLLVQSGENDNQKFIDMVSRCLEHIKGRHEDFVIILCLGNLSKKQYVQLRTTGAERYILKFETSNPEVYGAAKPNDTLEHRMRCLDDLLEAGFSVGSGNMVGLPGQTVTDIARDLMLARTYNFSMNSTSVFVPSERSKYRDEPFGDLEITLNTMALLRIMNPKRLMPTTSSLEKTQKGGQFRGLLAGANTITIHDGTPDELKSLFPIYSLKRVTPQKGYFEGIVERAHMKLAKEALYATC
jgi:biotin synthase